MLLNLFIVVDLSSTGRDRLQVSRSQLWVALDAGDLAVSPYGSRATDHLVFSNSVTPHGTVSSRRMPPGTWFNHSRPWSARQKARRARRKRVLVGPLALTSAANLQNLILTDKVWERLGAACSSGLTDRNADRPPERQSAPLACIIAPNAATFAMCRC
jgi:hypothetical protein